MTTVGTIYNLLDKIAPFSNALSFDNTGILVGDADAPVGKVAVCLDITKEAVKRAIENNCNLIVSHHPVIFNKLSKLDSNSVPYLMASNKISAICAHTNLDIATGGVNDRLAVALGIANAESLVDESLEERPKIARLGTVEPKSPKEFAEFVKAQLGSPDVRYIEGNSIIRKVCVYSGAGSDFAAQAKATGADAFVTSEIKHHQWLEANQLGITVIDAGHFSTENVIVKPLALLLKDKLDCEVSIISQSAPYKAL